MKPLKRLQGHIRGWLPKKPLSGEADPNTDAQINRKPTHVYYRKAFWAIVMSTLCVAAAFTVVFLPRASAAPNVSYNFSGTTPYVPPSGPLSLNLQLQVTCDQNIRFSPVCTISMLNATIENVLIPGVPPEEIANYCDLSGNTVTIADLPKTYGNGLGEFFFLILITPSVNASSFSVTASVTSTQNAHFLNGTAPSQLIYYYEASDGLYRTQDQT